MQNKIKNIIKEYWYLIGAVIIAGVVILYWFDRGTFISPEAIEYPIQKYKGEAEISVSEVGNISSPAPVYKINIYNISEFEDILNIFGISSQSAEAFTDLMVYGDDDNSVQYYPETGLAYLEFDSPIDIGISIDSEITDDTVEDFIEEFHNQVFSELPEFRLIESEINDSVEVALDYRSFDGKAFISSFYLKGCSIRAEFTKFGKLIKMDILMLSEVDFYQNMPIMSDNLFIDSVSLDSFPKAVEYTVTDKNYSDIHPVYTSDEYLSRVSFDDVRVSWVFFNKNNKLAIPVYIYTGTGLVRIDALNESFGSEVTMMASPIDPEFVIASEDATEDDEEIEDTEDNIGRGNGDLFIGGEL